MKKPKNACFRIRKIYFDKIVSGEKKEEIRSCTPFWFKRLIENGIPDTAVFVCGKSVHRRKIKSVYIDVPEKVLGRPLSLQGLKDITTQSCIVIELGEEVNL